MIASLVPLVLSLCWQADEAELLDRYREAEGAKERALVALENAYARIESALEAWRRREKEASSSLTDVLAGHVILSKARLDALRAAGGDDAAGTRRARRDVQRALEAEFDDKLQVRGLEEPGLREFIAGAASRVVAADSRTEGLGERIAEAIAPALDEGLAFHELWNEFLLSRTEEVREYRDRYNEYISAGVDLDRARNPNLYRPGGERVRAGMVFVPGGRGVVGPNTGFERRKRKVTLRPFLIDRREVSNAEYLLFLETLDDSERRAFLPRIWEADAAGEVSPTAEQMQRPVAGITWRQAAAYARWAGKRLPTEDEWEVACRGRDAWAYPWGDTYRVGRCNDLEAERGHTVDVGTMPEGESPYGVLHMAGNVEEWTASHEDGEVISQLTSSIAPIVVRGGHYLSTRDNVGGIFRWVAPGGSTREPYIGFRCAADLQGR